jgi:NTE family protein
MTATAPMLSAAPVLALGGGGVRGLAHLGVLAEFEAAGVGLKGLAGTSSGALMAALWLTRGSVGAIARVHEFVRAGLAISMPDLAAGRASGGWWARLERVRSLGLLARLLLRRNLMSHHEMLRRIGFLLEDLQIEELPLPFVAVATDNASGREIRLRHGSVRLAVAASSAMPGVVAPVHWDGLRLQDGGAVAEIPVAAARELGSPVVAVEVSEELPTADPDRDRLPRAMFRAAAMGWQALRQRLLAEADAVIAPAVNDLHWADYGAVDHAVEAGRRAARAFLASEAGARLLR